jgi:hypothetical protein
MLDLSNFNNRQLLRPLPLPPFPVRGGIPPFSLKGNPTPVF